MIKISSPRCGRRPILRRSTKSSKNAKQPFANRRQRLMARSNNRATKNWDEASARPQPPLIQLLGDIDHPDFRDAIELLRNDSRLIASAETRPELIVVAQSRPDMIWSDELNHLHRAAPLAGVVALAGSWCEGEMRTARPWPGAQRL